uniref:KRAB domain-containing protein n=1 Tax=Coturnix japonica TaxID=93934 RepID=A0A8C2T6Y3_COTJA
MGAPNTARPPATRDALLPPAGTICRVTLEEVTVCFSAEEWALLEEWQRELHREVTAATAQLAMVLGWIHPVADVVFGWGWP